MAGKAPKAYQIKVTLRGSSPPIWRRLEVPGDTRLDRLHQIIQVAMGWDDSHLHQFRQRIERKMPDRADLQAVLSGRRDIDLSAIRGERYYSHPSFELDEARDETKVRLDEVAPAVKSKFIYEYDFGDGWEHDVLVEKVGALDSDAAYPRCTAGKLACPPEDCGGIYGYYEMLGALNDPKHEMHAEYKDWAGAIDAERFDMDAVNKALARMRTRRSDRA